MVEVQLLIVLKTLKFRFKKIHKKLNQALDKNILYSSTNFWMHLNIHTYFLALNNVLIFSYFLYSRKINDAYYKNITF